MSDVMILANDQGVPFAARIVREGDLYGLNFCLTHDKPRPMVEFWDLRYPHAFVVPDAPIFGQFTGARYFVSTILGTDGYGSGEGGLRLDTGSPSWSIDAATMTRFRNWLRETV